MAPPARAWIPTQEPPSLPHTVGGLSHNSHPLKVVPTPSEPQPEAHLQLLRWGSRSAALVVNQTHQPAQINVGTSNRSPHLAYLGDNLDFLSLLT